MKVIARSWRCVLFFCLGETGLAQAAVAFEDLAVLTPNRLGADGGEFVISVRLVEGSVGNPAPAQSLGALEKLAFTWDATDDEMRMSQFSGQKGFRHLDGCVAGLDDLLRKRQVIPDEEVDVRRVVLRECHGWLLWVSNFLDSTLRLKRGKGAFAFNRSLGPAPGRTAVQPLRRRACQEMPVTRSDAILTFVPNIGTVLGVSSGAVLS